MSSFAPYIHQKAGWPAFTWDTNQLITPLAEVRNLQGVLLGKMAALGFVLQLDASLEALTAEVLKSHEIEGEHLEKAQVRSSLARRLGLDISGLVPSDRHVDGVVEMMLDAVSNRSDELTKERLCLWQASLFPNGISGMMRITTGDYRTDANGPMQVVSGALGKEKVHFEAPAAGLLEQEMDAFLQWFNTEDDLDPVLKAGVAHL